MCCATQLYAESLEDKGKLTVQIKPHKVRILNGVRVKDCWMNRNAFVITHRPHTGPEEATELSYSYLGGGIEYDPPNTYGIVSKSMPLAMADMFTAVVLFLTGGEVEQEFFIRTTYAQIRHTVTKEERTNEIKERVRKVQQRFESLRQQHQTGLRLLSHCGVNVYLGVSQHIVDFLNADRQRDR